MKPEVEMPWQQGDLFPDQPTGPQGVLPFGLEAPPPAEFIARIRAELEETLRTVQEAATLPWPDLTQATLAELRFLGIAGWLPEAEATALRADFEVEMARLYAAEDERLARTPPPD
jgi:hypothetical protein